MLHFNYILRIKLLYYYLNYEKYQQGYNYKSVHKTKEQEVVLGILKCPEKNTVPKAFFQEGDGMHRPQEQGLRTAAGSHDTEPKPETSNIGTKVGHSVLGVAPVLLSATALYRYTPVGSWVCKLSGYSPNSVSNMDEGVVEGILGNTQETDDILFSNTGNYISYKPI
ncbi:PIR Superfamily Protein [Plasmodium ovale wallikeri]|uniref:PIR Superfamily Protein n=1 Tax=Plasmodium ovale wallikeri TaxID=864142 RepID=A0A1A9AJN8_PLAOA|nr:PIR Superfamily Protein [Plasmodium ovale wallikeri]